MLKKLRAVLTHKRQENDVNDELRFHLEREIEQNIAKGMFPDEARRQALIAFGGVAQTRESLREVHRGRFFDALVQDVHYGLRLLRKTPGFTVVAVLTLALGIGANTAIFSLIDAVMFRTLPIENPNGLLLFQWQAHHGPESHGYTSFGECDDQTNSAHPFGCSLPLPFFREIQTQTSLFEHIAAYNSWGQVDMSSAGPARMVRNEFVTGDIFPTLGVRAHLGRLFVPSDDAAGAPAVAVLNYSFWQTVFGGERSAIGKTIKLNGVPFTIIGVTEPKFDALSMGNQYDIWVPLAKRATVMPDWKPRRDQMDSFWLVIVARLKPGVSVLQAQAAVSDVFRDAMLNEGKQIFKAEHDPRIKLASAARELGGSRDNTLNPLYVMMLCVGVVLLIACANVAGLLLARSAGRQREMAVRLALGASRKRIILQLLTESILLAAAGGVLGLIIAMWGARALMAMVTAGSLYPPGFSAHLDLRVLAFTAGISVLTGIIFGLAPALRSSDLGLTSSLKSSEGGLAVGSHGWQHLNSGGILVCVQIALSIVVLVTAVLLVRTLSNLKNLDVGFQPRGLLIFGVDPQLAGYKGQQIDNLYRDLQEKFTALPGVTSAAYSWVSLLGGGQSNTEFHRPGTPVDSNDQVEADVLPVGPKFFATVQIPFVAGRDFMPTDFTAAAANSNGKSSGSPTPAIVNQAFVHSYFPDVEPLGQLFGDMISTEPDEPNDPGYRIVGVVGNAKYYKLKDEIKPTFYVPNVGGDVYFELRTAGDPTALVPAVRNIVSHANDDLALFRISTQIQNIDSQLLSERMTAELSSFFGLVALVLACMGLYGLLSYEVTRRTREIGIRMAVGAQSHNVVKLVLGKALVLVAIGAAAGLAVSVGVTRFLKSVLFGVQADDPATLLMVSALLAVVALAASYIPARRATRVDPLVALRHE